MAKHKLGKVNQKLYFAGMYLELIEVAKNDDSLLNKKALTVAHQQSCLFHLVHAYQGFLWELANVYDIPCASPVTLAQVIENANKLEKPLGDLNRLSQLENEPNSWLSLMLQQWVLVTSADPESASTSRQPANLNAIEVRVWDEPDRLSQLSDWYGNLKVLVENMRELLVEW